MIWTLKHFLSHYQCRIPWELDRCPGTVMTWTDTPTQPGGGVSLPCPRGSDTHTLLVAPPRPAPKTAPSDTFSSAWRDRTIFFFLLVTSSVHKCVKTVKIFCLKLVCHYPRCIYIRSIHVLAIDGVYKLQYTQTHLFSLRSMHQTRLSVNPVCYQWRESFPFV